MSWDTDFPAIDLGSVTSMADIVTGNSTATLTVTGHCELSADNTTAAQLSETGGDVLTTEYGLSFDGDGSAATGGSDVSYTAYDSFLSPAVSVTHVSGDDSVDVTLSVRASVPAGEAPNAGSYSATQTITAHWLAGSPPAAPSGLACEAKTDTCIDIWWTDNANNEDGFSVERKTGASGTWSEIERLAADSTGYSDCSMAPETTYYYRVRAYNDDGYSDYSNETYCTTLAPGLVPYAPRDLEVYAWENAGVYGCHLVWRDQSSNEDGFGIERQDGGEGGFVLIDTVGPSEEIWVSYDDPGLDPNTEYCYRVYAYNANGNSGYSNTACATTPQ
ncbi:MAG: fibronectin type III domain-containing protein [Candidatus Brocadiia bacterium]